jgi:multicomponent Na+:H+ antiporter subunit C
MTAFVLATVLGILFAAGTFLLLRRDVLRIVWGVTVLSQAANVYLMTMGGIVEPSADGVPVLAGHGEHVPQTTDPLVQALVLTAIVISFAMTAFALVLTYRVYQEHSTLDTTTLEEEP